MSNTNRTMLQAEAFRPLTPAELHETVLRARAQRTQALASSLRLMARGLRRIVTRCGAAIVRLRQARAEERRLRLARVELYGMSDAALKDMGLTRSEIAWVVEHGRSDDVSPAAGVSRMRPLAGRDPGPQRASGAVAAPTKQRAA